MGTTHKCEGCGSWYNSSDGTHTCPPDPHTQSDCDRGYHDWRYHDAGPYHSSDKCWICGEIRTREY